MSLNYAYQNYIQILNLILFPFSYSLFNHDISSSYYYVLLDGMIVNNEFIRMWKEVVCTWRGWCSWIILVRAVVIPAKIQTREVLNTSYHVSLVSVSLNQNDVNQFKEILQHKCCQHPPPSHHLKYMNQEKEHNSFHVFVWSTELQDEVDQMPVSRNM